MIYFPFQIQTNLGNWMFQYATAFSKQGEVVGYLEDFGAEKKLRAYGDLFGKIKLVKKLPEDLKEYKEPRFLYQALPDVLKAGDWLLRGYYQSEKYFDRDKTLKLFAPTKERVAYLKSKYGDWLARSNVTGISVRRGDYMWKAQWHPFVGKRYLGDCLAKLSECDDFIVCSDDIPWCKKWFPKAFPKKRFLFVEGESVLDQLYVHTLCKNNIVSNSSFSWWGAWLNRNPTKRVLAPSQWFGFAYERIGMDWSSIYGEGWEVVKNRYTVGRYVWGHMTLAWKKFKVWAYPMKKALLGR